MAFPCPFRNECARRLGERSCEIAKQRLTPRNILERGVASVTRITTIAAPAETAAIVNGKRADRMGKLVEQRWIGDLGLVEVGDEQGSNCHGPLCDAGERRASMDSIKRAD